MNDLDPVVRYALRDYVTKNVSFRDNCAFECFESAEKSDDGQNSDVFFGRVVCKDKYGKLHRSESLAIKIFPKPRFRSKYIDMTFSNEIFFYTKILPFYASFHNSILNMFPKFHYGCIAAGNGDDNENAIVILANLSTAGHQAPKIKTFLNLEHLLLSVKSLARFHAYSYYAKSAQPRVFQNLTRNLVETHSSATKACPGFLNLLNDHFTEMLKSDRKYSAKIQRIRETLRDADTFMETVFTTADEPMAVICHGDFVKNNLVFEYDSEQRPVDVTFIDLASARYCSPSVDLALILYMNADQDMRNRYWDQLIDAYCTSLRDTFPTIDVPTKNQITGEFKTSSLYAYLLISFFLPAMLDADENGAQKSANGSDPEDEEFTDLTTGKMSAQKIFRFFARCFNSYREEKVLDVLKDIIDRGFV